MPEEPISSIKNETTINVALNLHHTVTSVEWRGNVYICNEFSLVYNSATLSSDKTLEAETGFTYSQNFPLLNFTEQEIIVQISSKKHLLAVYNFVWIVLQDVSQNFTNRSDKYL